MQNDQRGYKLFCGTSSQVLGKQVADKLGIPLGNMKLSKFSDGEIQLEIHESIRGEHVFILQSTHSPVNHNYMELFIMLDAFKRASAKMITAIIPYFGYARQDRKVASRAPISAKLMADLLTTAGADRVVSIDLHATQIQGFFNVPVDHLFATPTLARAWTDFYGSGDQFVAVSPDAGGVERARAFGKRIGAPMAIIDKRRTAPNEAKAMALIGDVSGKTAIIVDDMIDTAGTLTQAVDSLYKNGAKRVFAIATHPVLSGPAVERLKNSPVEKVLVTDTVPLPVSAVESGKFQVISMTDLLADAINRVHINQSVSSLFD